MVPSVSPVFTVYVLPEARLGLRSFVVVRVDWVWVAFESLLLSSPLPPPEVAITRRNRSAQTTSAAGARTRAEMPLLRGSIGPPRIVGRSGSLRRAPAHV